MFDLGLDEPEYITETGHLVWGGMPIELEAAELLYALVRYAKPRVVVESGTGSGRSTQAIALALQANGNGVVHTFEPQHEFFVGAEERFSANLFVETHFGTSRESGIWADMVFIDTGGGEEHRQPEIDHWAVHEAKPLLVIHDGNRAYDYPSNGVNIPGWDGVWIGRG